MKAIKITYWITTVLAGLQFILAAVMYFTRNEEVLKGFGKIGMPMWFIMFLGTAKLLGGIGIILPTPLRLKEWTYAGMTFVLIGATYAHIVSNTSVASPLIALVILAASYVTRLKAYPNR